MRPQLVALRTSAHAALRVVTGHNACSFLHRLTAADPTVGAHLEAQSVDPHYFAFRWMTVLFSQDMERLEDVLRVWDFLFGDPLGCKDAVMRFCCALLLVRPHMHALCCASVLRLCAAPLRRCHCAAATAKSRHPSSCAGPQLCPWPVRASQVGAQCKHSASSAQVHPLQEQLCSEARPCEQGGMCYQSHPLFSMVVAKRLLEGNMVLVQRQRTQLLAVGFPEVIKVLQNCGREGFDAEDTINIASSLSSQYIP
jgi:hypothetical protein